MTDTDLAAAIGARARLAPRTAARVLDAAAAEVAARLARGERVAVPGLGTFATSRRGDVTGTRFGPDEALRAAVVDAPASPPAPRARRPRPAAVVADAAPTAAERAKKAKAATSAKAAKKAKKVKRAEKAERAKKTGARKKGKGRKRK